MTEIKLNSNKKYLANKDWNKNLWEMKTIGPYFSYIMRSYRPAWIMFWNLDWDTGGDDELFDFSVTWSYKTFKFDFKNFYHKWISRMFSIFQVMHAAWLMIYNFISLSLSSVFPRTIALVSK